MESRSHTSPLSGFLCCFFGWHLALWSPPLTAGLRVFCGCSEWGTVKPGFWLMAVAPWSAPSPGHTHTVDLGRPGALNCPAGMWLAVWPTGLLKAQNCPPPFFFFFYQFPKQTTGMGTLPVHDVWRKIKDILIQDQKNRNAFLFVLEILNLFILKVPLQFLLVGIFFKSIPSGRLIVIMLF